MAFREKVTKIKGYVKKYLWKIEDTFNYVHRSCNENKQVFHTGLWIHHYSCYGELLQKSMFYFC
jgi:hypothetical protein